MSVWGFLYHSSFSLLLYVLPLDTIPKSISSFDLNQSTVLYGKMYQSSELLLSSVGGVESFPNFVNRSVMKKR